MEKKDVEVVEPFPDALSRLAAACHGRTRIHLSEHPDDSWYQCIVNKYESGEGIGAHIDNHEYGPWVMTYTLDATAEDRLRLKTGNEDEFIRQTPHNSAYLLKDELRATWTNERPKLKRGIVLFTRSLLGRCP